MTLVPQAGMKIHETIYVGLEIARSGLHKFQA